MTKIGRNKRKFNNTEYIVYLNVFCDFIFNFSLVESLL